MGRTLSHNFKLMFAVQYLDKYLSLQLRDFSILIVGQQNKVDDNNICNDEPVDIASEIETLEDRFDDLRTRIINELSAKPGITVQILLDKLTSLPVALKKEYESSIAMRLPNMRAEIKINELFIHLNPLTSFIDYGLIEHFIRKFGSDTLKGDMRSYCSEMMKFMKETTIKQLIDHLPGQADTPPNFSLIEAKIGQNASECTLEQLNTIRKRYCSEVKLSEIIFHLVAVVESNSFIVRWLVPSTIVSDVIKSTKGIEQSFFQECKITSLTLDGMWLFLIEAEMNIMWSRMHVSDTKFKDQFHTMYRQIMYEVEMEGVSEHEISLSLNDQQPPHVSIHSSRSFQKVDSRLSLVGFTMLTAVIKRFGSDCLKRVMKCYCDYVISIYTNLSTAQQLIALSPIPSSLSKYFTTAECRIMEKPLKFGLEKLLSFQTQFCTSVHINKVCFVMCEMNTEISSDSFIVRWLVPSALVSDIMRSARNIEQAFYQEYKITTFTLDTMWLYLNEAEIDAMWLRVHVDDTKFKDQFQTMYKQILFELEMQEISEYDLSLHLMDQQPHFQGYLSKVFQKHDSLLSLVGCKTLVTIIERFGSDCLKRVMISYSKYVQSICSSQLTVQQLLALSSMPLESSKYFVIAECRIMEKPLMLKKLLNFQTRFCNMININRVCFIMNEMSMEVNDSFIVRWILPSAISDNIVKSANNAELDLYQACRITSFTVDTIWLYLSEAEIDKMWSQMHVSDTRFKDQFHTMYKQIVRELEIGGISEHDLSLYLMEQQPKLKKQVSDCLSGAILKRECPSSFIDFRVLTIIIERFGSDCLKRVMRSCYKYMSTFTKQSTVQHMIDLPPVQSKPSKYFVTVKCKIEEEPSGYRLERLLCLRSELCHILDIDDVCFVIDEISIELSSSFTVSWLVPSPLISNIMKSARNILYQKYKITCFTLDSMWLCINESEISAMWSVSNIKVKDQFHTMFKQILCELEIEEVSEHDLLYLMNQLPKVDSNVSLHISRAFQGQKLSSSFGILSIIIEKFGSDCLKRVVKSFFKQSTVQQLIDLSAVQFKPFNDFITAECRIMEEPSHYKLEKLLRFQSRFCTLVNVNNVCFVMVKISQETNGSFTVNWLIPSNLAFDMLKSVNQIKETELFLEFNIASLQLGSGWLYHHQLTSFGDKLKERYQQSQGSPSPVEWIPSPTKKIFRLAMIQRERVQRGHIEDRFVQMTISGRVDDILHAKSPVELEHIFRNTLRGGEIILIEGAPGSGKSTLTVHICQRWGKGDLFQQFTVVILVQLRDPAVQRAQTIADLLPVESDTFAQELASELIATNGRGVLLVLDGWDELPCHLQQDSIFRRLLPPKVDSTYDSVIPGNNDQGLLEEWDEFSSSLSNPSFALQNDKERLFHECSVIVTSRPISSGDLHPVVSSRFEVLGFTPEEQRQYFTECLKGDTKALEALLEKIQENPMVQSICYLPLNAAFIIHTFKYKDQALPNTEYEIYLSVILSCIQRHFERDCEDHDLPRELASLDDLSRSGAVREPFQCLCELAYCGVMKNKVTFSSGDLPQGSNTLSLLQAVESFLQSGKSMFYNFLHLSIQEVLSAYYIATQLSDSEQVSQFQQLFNQPRFAAVFQFYAAITKLKSPGIHQIIDGIVKKSISYDRFQPKPLLLSLFRCLHEAQDPSLCHYVTEQLDLDIVAKMQYVILDLSGNSLSPLECLSVSFFLFSSGKNFKIACNNCSIGDLGVKNLVKYLDSGVDHVGKVTMYLEVSNNDIHEEGASHIARTVSFIGHLNLSDNPIGDTGASLISEAVKEVTTLKTLILRSCGITSRGASCIATIFYFVEHIYLTNNQITDTGASLISKAVRETTTLKTLILYNCGITSRGAEDLSRALAQNSSLEKLDIGGNDIGDEGVSHVAEALKENKQLKELWIGDCAVTDKGAASLASALRVNNSLKMLHMGINRGALTEDGLLTIAQSLGNNSEFVKVVVPYGFIASRLYWKFNEVRKENGLPPIEIKGKLCIGCYMGMFM